MDKVEVFCDGACRGNGKKKNIGGWGIYVLYKGHEKRIKGFRLNTTNNIMELVACIEALKLFTVYDIPMIITTDSKYVVNGINSWSIKWKANGWKNAKKKPVENKELWVEFIGLANKFEDLIFLHCKGHASNEGNIIADSLANNAIDGVLLQ